MIVCRLQAVLEHVEQEARDCYMQSQRIAMLDYIMLDPQERARLNIQTYPVRYPALAIRAPVPWHQSYITATERAFYSLYIGNSMIHALRDLWDTRYNTIVMN